MHDKHNESSSRLPYDIIKICLRYVKNEHYVLRSETWPVTRDLSFGKSYHQSSGKPAHSFVSLIDESVYERIVVWLESVVFRPKRFVQKMTQRRSVFRMATQLMEIRQSTRTSFCEHSIYDADEMVHHRFGIIKF